MAADDDGVFVVEVPLREGENVCEVEARDALGGRQVQVGRLRTRDTLGPKVRVGVEYGP